MPEFIIPDEADHCPHCGKVLLTPPNCCDKMIAEYEDEELRWLELVKRDYGQYIDSRHGR
jgi:hypothetical protein